MDIMEVRARHTTATEQCSTLVLRVVVMVLVCNQILAHAKQAITAKHVRLTTVLELFSIQQAFVQVTEPVLRQTRVIANQTI
jgi:hypothetical protein